MRVLPTAATCILLAVAAASSVPSAHAQTPGTAAEPVLAPIDPSLIKPLPYTVVLNGKNVGVAVLLYLLDGRLLASESDLQRWHLGHPVEPTLRDGGEAYYLLNNAAGFDARLDEQSQEARLKFDAAAFTSTTLSASPDSLSVAQRPGGLGSFLNYDLVANRSEQGASHSDSVDGQVETGVFGDWGVATSQWLARNLATNTRDSPDRRIVRLDSTYTRDNPDTLTTLEVGDAIGGAGLFGRPVRIGGLRWSRNFATQPGFVTLPQPSLSGETALPSVLDVYVDGIRRQSLDLLPGPFQINSLPVLTGRGEVELVVRDLLGREQRITQSYFTGVRQLRAGLHDYSYEAGFVRERFGSAGNDYGQFVAVGTHRYGFSDRFTGEARLELQGDRAQTAGFGGVLSVPLIGVFSSAAAFSHGERGTGALSMIALERTIRRGLSLGARVQLTSPNFTQTGLAVNGQAPERLLGDNLGYSIAGLGNFGLGYVNLVNRTPRLTTSAVTGSFSTGLFRRASASLILLDRFEPRQDYSISVNFSLPFAGRNYASAGYRVTDSGADSVGRSYARVQRNQPQGDGWGYRAQVEREDGASSNGQVDADVGLSWNGPYGSYGLEAARFNQQMAYRADLSGGLGAFAGHGFAARKLTNSFAIVDTGVADLELLVHSQPTARTNADGVAVLPYLQPYQRNSVRINDAELPIDVSILDQQADATPYFRSGMLLHLTASKGVGALLTLVGPDGRLLPAGAMVRLTGSSSDAPVGKNGQSYLSGLQVGTNTAEANWANQHCTARFNLPANAGFQPSIGPVRCEETSR